MPTHYAITHARNSGIKDWRGLLRGYAVTRTAHMHVCAGVQAGVCVRACMHLRVCRNRVSA